MFLSLVVGEREERMEAAASVMCLPDDVSKPSLPS